MSDGESSGRRGVVRRRFLKRLGSAGVGAGVVSLGAGTADADSTVRVNVGYRGPSGREAALAVAEEVVYEFAFDALTLVVHPGDVDDLRRREDVR